MRAKCVARHALQIFLGGLGIAGFVAKSVLNLCTPLFATAFMARQHKRLARAPPAPFA